MGGFLGLLLGASVLTVCELFDYIIRRLSMKIYHLGTQPKLNKADNIDGKTACQEQWDETKTT